MALREHSEVVRSPEHYLVRRHRVTCLPTAEQRALLPIHSKPVREMRLDAILDDMKRTAPHRYLRICALFDLLSEAGSKPSSPPTLHMDPHHADTLVRDGILEKVDSQNLPSNFTWVESFVVLEAAKGRLRQIHWPKHALRSSRYSSGGHFSLRSTLQIRNMMADSLRTNPDTWALVTDMIAGFYQVPLPESCGHFLCKDAKGNVFRLSRLLMGLDVSPELLQLILEHVVNRAQQNAGQAPPTDIHIDNVLCLGEKSDMLTLRDELLRLAEEWHVSFDQIEVCREFDYCGIVANLHLNNVRLRDALCVKMASDLQLQRLCLVDLERIFGRILFAAPVLRLRIEQHYFAFKLYRRLLSAWRRGLLDPNAAINVQPTLERTLRRLGEVIVANQPMTLSQAYEPAPTAYLYSDASLKGYGAVLFYDGTITAMGDIWNSQLAPRDINAAEAVAARQALHFAASRLQGPVALTIRLDNTSALSAAWGRANQDGMRLLRAALSIDIERLEAMGIDCRFEWVSTLKNFADEPSRREARFVETWPGYPREYPEGYDGRGGEDQARG
jgi:hypothetical protein